MHIIEDELVFVVFPSHFVAECKFLSRNEGIKRMTTVQGEGTISDHFQFLWDASYRPLDPTLLKRNKRKRETQNRICGKKKIMKTNETECYAAQLPSFYALVILLSMTLSLNRLREKQFLGNGAMSRRSDNSSFVINRNNGVSVEEMDYLFILRRLHKPFLYLITRRLKIIWNRSMKYTNTLTSVDHKEEEWQP